MEVEYSVLRIRVLLDEIAEGKRGIEHVDVGKALKRLPLMHRYCLTSRAQGYTNWHIAKKLFGRSGRLEKSVVADFLEAGEMRLYLEVNGGEV